MTPTEETFNILKPRYEKAFQEYNGEGSHAELSFSDGWVYLTATASTGTGTSKHRVSDIQNMTETLEQRVADGKKFKAPGTNFDNIKALEHGGFYWVRLGGDGRMEVAEYCAETNRLKFTNGSRCEPERVSYIDIDRLMWPH